MRTNVIIVMAEITERVDEEAVKGRLVIFVSVGNVSWKENATRVVYVAHTYRSILVRLVCDHILFRSFSLSLSLSSPDVCFCRVRSIIIQISIQGLSPPPPSTKSSFYATHVFNQIHRHIVNILRFRCVGFFFRQSLMQWKKKHLTRTY
jgi:hypothetical protein